MSGASENTRAKERVLVKLPDLAELRRGWCLGAESFRARILRLLDSSAEKLRDRVSREAPFAREHGEEEPRSSLNDGLEYFFAPTREDLQTFQPGEPCIYTA